MDSTGNDQYGGGEPFSHREEHEHQQQHEEEEEEEHEFHQHHNSQPLTGDGASPG